MKREDIPQIVGLNKKLFPTSRAIPDDVQHRLYDEVCLQNPWYDDDIAPLVYEEADGRITGFLGVVPRSLKMNGRIFRAAVFQHLMTDRSTLASVQMFTTLLAGPQDLSMGENAIDVVRRIWMVMKHPLSRINSIYWRRLLRPASSGAAKFHRRCGGSLLSAPLLPLARIVDAAACRVPFPLFRYTRAATADPEMDACMLLTAQQQIAPAGSLQPDYTEPALSWLMATLARETRNGVLQKKIVHTASGAVAGWYIYYLKKGGTSLVYQVTGTDATFGLVLEHLFTDAERGGSFGLLGRLEPRFMKHLSDKGCLFMPGRNWMLLHSRHPELLYAINSGEAFLSRMEGDMWVL